MTELDLLPVACEQFLGKSVMEIKAVVLQTLEGHLRSILGLKVYVILTLWSHKCVFLMLWSEMFLCLDFEVIGLHYKITQLNWIFLLSVTCTSLDKPRNLC